MRAWSLRDLCYKQYFNPIRLQPKCLESRIWVAVTGLYFNNSLCGVCCLLVCENPGFNFGPGTKRQHTRKAQSSNNWAELIRWSLWGLRISNLQIFLPSLICFPATTHCFPQPLFSYRKSGLTERTCRELKKAAMETLEKSLRNRHQLWSQQQFKQPKAICSSRQLSLTGICLWLPLQYLSFIFPWGKCVSGLGISVKKKKSTVYLAFYKQSFAAFSYGCKEEVGSGMRLDEFG